MKKIFTLLTLALISIGSAWADDVIFSMTSITGPTTAITHKADPTTVSATFSPAGSSAEVYNGHSSNDAVMCNGNINLAGSGNSYFHAHLTTALAAGDVITLSQNDKFKIGAVSGTVSSVDFPYTIPLESALIGKTDIYIKKDDEGTRCFTSFTITRPTGTSSPVFSQSGSTITISCATGGATIYYTTDGSEPTTSSTVYSAPFDLENSCTVRAFAKKGDDASTIVKRDCYVDHNDAVAVLRYNGGDLDGDSKIWTSSDGNYTFTISTNTFAYAPLAESTDGFKLNHVDTYTLTTPANLKITKILVVGKSWSDGYTAAMSIDGFATSPQSFYAYDGETYVKTLEFTPTAARAYGAPLTFRPSGSQCGAYIEIYGNVATEPSNPAAKETVTQTVTFNGDGAVCSNVDILTMAGGGIKNPTYAGYTKAMEMSSSAVVTIKLPASSTNASVTLLGTNASITLKLNSDSKTAVTWGGNSTDGYNLTIAIDDSNAGGTYTIRKGDGSSQIHKITLTYDIPSASKITLETTAEMEGWRSFYDATNSYTVDGNTTVYVATSEAAGTVTMTPNAAGIPANTPVILKTTAGNHKMTLTKASVADYAGTNLLAVTAGTEALDNYRLGYGAAGVGFYKYNVASAPAGIVYLNVAASSRESLSFNFEDETTGVNEVKVQKTGNQYFNLAGQRVAQPAKGLYIVNGKKVIMK